MDSFAWLMLGVGALAGALVAGGLLSVRHRQLGDALLLERSLLYVAATRARDELVITAAGEPSELIRR